MTRAAIATIIGVACVGCYAHHEREPDRDAAAPPRVRIVSIGAGDDHTCAIDEVGAVWCWGFAQQGQVGDGSGDPSRCAVGITEGPIVDRPVRVSFPGDLGVSAITGGPTHTCAVGSSGYACWGANCRGQLGNDSTRGTTLPEPRAARAQGIWAGAAHTCLARDDGLACTGANERGQLGLGTTSPLSEPGAISFTPIAGLRSIVDAGLGEAHTCALESSGVVWCWGANGAGQLGDGTFEVRSVPAFVRGLPSGVISIAAGDRHTCAATERDAWCWGWNDRGQLGNGAACTEGDEDCVERPLPERVRFEGTVDEIDARSQLSCLRSGGEVWCWGANDVGQLGNGTRVSSAIPVRVRGIDDAIAIACGASHACAILGDGRLTCWGRNAQGQLGVGVGEDALTPVGVRFGAP